MFPNKLKGVKQKWIPLVEALHSFGDIDTGPFILAHLYHLLHEMTKGEPFETNLNGPPAWSNSGSNGTSPNFRNLTWNS